MVFADPPYFLSNDGLTVEKGKIVSVNKGDWDKSFGMEYINDFNRRWLSLVRDKMREDATIWISGTMHNIFSIGQVLRELGFISVKEELEAHFAMEEIIEPGRELIL